MPWQLATDRERLGLAETLWGSEEFRVTTEGRVAHPRRAHPGEPGFLPLPAAAQVMGLHPDEVLELCNRGALEAYRNPGGATIYVEPAVLGGPGAELPPRPDRPAPRGAAAQVDALPVPSPGADPAP